MSSLSQKMFHIFAGNLNWYGADTGDGSGGMAVEQPLSQRVLEAHLRGEQGIGVYPVWHNDDGVLMASWGCCDIDTGIWSDAFALATTLKAMGMVPHVERSRSKGWHIWVFPEQVVTAAQMRRALKVAYAAIELPAKEANPKQEELKPGQKGNYVRLPYKGALKTTYDRQCFMSGWDAESDGIVIPATDWLFEYGNHFTTPTGIIEDWSAKWKEPKRKHIVNLDPVGDDKLKDLVGHLPGDLYLFVKSGPANDRSSGLVALAYKLRSHGYTAKEIFSVLQVAHQQWGSKYAGRDPDKYLIDIVERVVQ